MFPDLRPLKLKWSYSHQVDSHGTVVAIGNLLQCCPSMQKFCLCDLPSYPYEFPGLLDLVKSIDIESFEMITSTTATTPSGDDYDTELAALEARSFHCLDHHLRKIRIEFKSESFDCFEVRLTKFFVENAAVLEEMEVHAGDQGVYDHIHHKLAEWRANSSKTKINIIVGKHNKRF